LLEPVFPGRDALYQQIDYVLGWVVDENGSLDLECEATTTASVNKRIPTEGEALDQDGTTIHYLLHVVAGKMKELEIYKDDSSKVVEHPDPSEVEVIILG
jgi:hypothetical protein